MKKYQTLLLLVAILNGLLVFSQARPGGKSELQSNYRVVNRTLSLAEKNEIHMNEAPGAGIAWLNGKSFTNGTIEFDVKGKDVLQKSFVGIAFHGVNDTTYEAIYFRPFNFKSDDPSRKSHGVQYIAIPGYDWPKLRDEFPNKYEQAVLPAPDPNDWIHTRITVNGKKISVFVNDNSKASLVVESLVDFKGRQIGLWVGNGSGGDWKNLKITPVAN